MIINYIKFLLKMSLNKNEIKNGFTISNVISVNDGFAIISKLKNAGSGTVVEIYNNNTLKLVALGLIIKLSSNGLNTVSILGDFTLVSPGFWVKTFTKSYYITINAKLLVN